MKLDFMYWAVFSAYAELAHSHTLAGHLYKSDRGSKCIPKIVCNAPCRNISPISVLAKIWKLSLHTDDVKSRF